MSQQAGSAPPCVRTLCIAAAFAAATTLAPGAAWAKKCFNTAHLLEAQMRWPQFSKDPLLASLRTVQRLDRYAELSPDRCVRAVTALAARLLDDDNVEVRQLAADALRFIGPPAAAALPALREAQKRSSCACKDGRCQWDDNGPGVSIGVAIITIEGNINQPDWLNCQPTDLRPTPTR